MTTYTTISNTLVQVGAYPFATTIQALRDNISALGENDATVPVAMRLPPVLLGTLTTTSGASQTLSSLVLTSYKSMRLVFIGVSTNSATGNIDVASRTVTVTTAAGNTWRGIVDIDLVGGILSASLAASGSGSTAVPTPYAGNSTLTTASTSVVVATSVGAFDAGSINIYGVR